MCHTEQTHYTHCGHWIRTTKTCPNQDADWMGENSVYLKQCGFAVLPDVKDDGACPYCLSAKKEYSNENTHASALVDGSHISGENKAHIHDISTTALPQISNSTTFPTPPTFREINYNPPSHQYVRANLASLLFHDPEARARHDPHHIIPSYHQGEHETNFTDDTPPQSPKGGRRWSCPSPGLSVRSDSSEDDYNYGMAENNSLQRSLLTESLRFKTKMRSTTPFNAWVSNGYVKQSHAGQIHHHAARHESMGMMKQTIRMARRSGVLEHCRHGSHRELNQRGDDRNLGLCKYHKKVAANKTYPC